VEAQRNKPFYVFIYDLGPCWQVEHIYQGTYAVVTPQSDGESFKGTMSKKLRMTVPDQMKENGYSLCEDIIKIFVTSQPTSFDLLELPRLCEATKARKVDRTSQEGGSASENWATLNFPICTSL